jgi:hypothetical protein
MELVLHAASVHVHPASRARHERCRAILDAAGVRYATNDTLEVPRETILEATELPQLAVRRPAMDVVFASFDTLVEWNDAGALVAQIEKTVSRALVVADKEIFKENMRLRARRLTIDVGTQTDGAAKEAASAAEAAKAASAAEAGARSTASELRKLASEAIESSASAEREADAMRQKAATARAALCKMMSVVPTLLEVAAVLAEP